MTVPSVNTTDVGNFTLYYVMLQSMLAQPFIVPTKPTYPEIYTVTGHKTTLSCNASQLNPENSINLISWYKDESKTPFYTVDARKFPLRQAKHFPSPEFSSRSSFDLNSEPPQLFIDPVHVTDDGIYRCLVEFKAAPTMNNLIRLSVITPPEMLYILDPIGNELSGTIGPYDEDSNITVNCIAIGGVPLPNVTWWQESMLISNNYWNKSNDETHNELFLNFNRQSMGKTFTCQAYNTNLVQPLSASITIDLNLKPLGVKITSPETHLRELIPALIECESWGAKPPTSLSWWIDGIKMHSRNETQSSSVTRSSIIFTPAASDNGKELTCRAEHVTLTKDSIEYGWTLTVFC